MIIADRPISQRGMPGILADPQHFLHGPAGPRVGVQVCGTPGRCSGRHSLAVPADFPDGHAVRHYQPRQIHPSLRVSRMWQFPGNGCLPYAASAPRSDAMLAVNRTAGTVQQLLEFSDHLRQTLRWAEKTLAGASHEAGLAGQHKCCPGYQKAPDNTENNAHRQTIADRATFCARWGGKSCYLGNTLSFRLLERLAHRPNQLFCYDTLLQDVWESKRSREAVRSVVKVLRQKLRAAGMDDLAQAIDGNAAHHYGLMLDRYSSRHPTGFTQVPTVVSHSTMPQY